MTDKPVSGAAKQVRGSVTEAIGKLTGDKAAEAEGAAQKREGEAEATAGLEAAEQETPPP